MRKHLSIPWRAPLHWPSQEAFAALRRLVGPEITTRELIFDSGCGAGEATRQMARAFPGALVIGIDRSEKRLCRTGHQSFPAREGNIVWVRAELSSFWRMAAAAGWRLARHYLLYPNPSPKPGQVLRRWHAHPVFPELLALGGMIELRSNWKVYVEEFALALAAAGLPTPRLERLQDVELVSRFEQKYRASGHALYRLQVALPARPTAAIS